jgi:hypothetical protein
MVYNALSSFFEPEVVESSKKVVTPLKYEAVLRSCLKTKDGILEI